MPLVWVPMSIKAPWHEYRGAYPRPLLAFSLPGWTIISNNGVHAGSAARKTGKSPPFYRTSSGKIDDDRKLRGVSMVHPSRLMVLETEQVS